MSFTHTGCFVARRVTILAVLGASIVSSLGAQQSPQVARLVADPARLTITIGETVPFKVTAYDAQGNVIPDAPVYVAAPRGVLYFRDGQVTTRQVGTYTRAGTFTAVATSTTALGEQPVTLEIPVTITWPALAKLEVTPAPGRLYTGITLTHTVKGFHADGSERTGLTVTWHSSNPVVAAVDRFGNVTGLKPGSVTITATAKGVTATRRYTVATNPAATIELGIKEQTIRTGDVIHLLGTAKRANGTPVPDAPITWSYTYTPDDSIAAPGGPGIIDFGRFAANYAGRYTLLARSGAAHARVVLDVKPRDVRQRITVTGRGSITNTHTSDLWPWTGKDGRDYCLVGTWGGDGYALVYDITDLTNPVKTDSIKVDARSINDVTVSPDGRYGVLSREGASNRINGVVILDLANPAHPKIASMFSEELTGGVHNLFATNDHLFAVSGGEKYVIIDVKDIYAPKYMSEYRHPKAGVHDLWVHDGIAYSAQYGVGAVAVDVGNGRYGGSIDRPKLINVFPIRSGHEIFPYVQRSTGRVYLFIGDEEVRDGRVWEGTNRWSTVTQRGGIPLTWGGYTHIVDFTDPMKPRKVARYHLEDYGSHDIIVQDDVLYQAYYDGGVRLVDVSGELLGNLYDQGREIAVFKPYDPQGHIANSPFVMNAMPWKGHVLFTDFNSGLWAAKLEPRQPLAP